MSAQNKKEASKPRTNNSKTEKDLARRKRINRIKSGIISCLMITLLACLTLIGLLLYKTNKLTKEINELKSEVSSNSVIEMNDVVSINSDIKKLKEEIEAVKTISEEKPKKEKDNTEDKRDVYDEISYSDNTLSFGEVPKVYLTFDDGPSDNTEDILKILEKHDVKATFFVNGRTDEKSLDRYKKLADAGHAIGMHSYSHKYSTIYSSVEDFDEDFNKLYTLIKDACGVVPYLYRFPGGSSNTVSSRPMREFVDYLGEKNMVYYDWNVACGDATNDPYTKEDLVENVMKDVTKYKYSVVLMHDCADKDLTVEALDIILDRLEEIGAEVLPITEDTPVIHHPLSN